MLKNGPEDLYQSTSNLVRTVYKKSTLFPFYPIENLSPARVESAVLDMKGMQASVLFQKEKQDFIEAIVKAITREDHITLKHLLYFADKFHKIDPAEIMNRDTEDNLLTLAIKLGFIQCANELVKAGVTEGIDTFTSEGKTLLLMACYLNDDNHPENSSMVHNFLKAGANPNLECKVRVSRDSHRPPVTRTPLDVTVSRGTANALRKLLAGGAVLQAADGLKEGLLTLAAKRNPNVEVLELLCDHPEIDVNTLTRAGVPAIYLALLSKQFSYQKLKVLLSAGAELYLPETEYPTPMHYLLSRFDCLYIPSSGYRTEPVTPAQFALAVKIFVEHAKVGTAQLAGILNVLLEHKIFNEALAQVDEVFLFKLCLQEAREKLEPVSIVKSSSFSSRALQVPAAAQMIAQKEYPKAANAEKQSQTADSASSSDRMTALEAAFMRSLDKRTLQRFPKDKHPARRFTIGFSDQCAPEETGLSLTWERDPPVNQFSEISPQRRGELLSQWRMSARDRVPALSDKEAGGSKREPRIVKLFI